MKRIVCVMIMAVCSVFVFSARSHAESYLSVYIGGVSPHDADVQDNSGIGTSADLSFEPGVSAGAKLGYWISGQNKPDFGLQLELNGHFPSFDTLTVYGSAVAINADMAVYSLTANVIVRYPEGAIRPYAGFGGGLSRGEIDDGTIRGFSFQGEDDDAFIWQFLAGFDYIINPKLSAFGEYKYSGADFEFGGEVGLDMEYRVSQIIAGISYHF